MIYGIGTDVVEVVRIKESIEKYGDKLAKKILTDKEMIAYKSSTLKENFLAKRFAAKEAFSKALGTGFRMNLNFKDIEVVNNKMGKPYYVKNKKITKIIQKNYKIKNFKCFLSISDEKNYSTAFAIIQTS